MPRTQSRMTGMSATRERLRLAVRRDKEVRLTSFYHHVFNVDHLREAYFCLKREAAPGVDGETWQQYGQDLEKNLQDLSERLQRGAYRTTPVRRAYIAKADGRQRPLGLPAREDKIVQGVPAQIFSVIWEDVILVRYADDLVVGIQHRADAEQFQRELIARLHQFDLELHADKTRLIEFGRYAVDNRAKRGEGKPEIFHFLGFTHICGTTRQGRFTVLRQTLRKRM